MSSRYQQLLQEKIQRMQTQFSCFAMPDLEVFDSPEQYYRMRAEFRIWHTEHDLFYAMFERGSDPKQKTVVRIDEFPMACKAINTLMPVLLDALKNNPLLGQRVFEVHFLATLKGEMLVTLIYHRKLEAAWQDAARLLAQQLNIKIMGRSRGQKIIISDDFVIERFDVDQKKYEYQQIESSFTQPNAVVCEKMLQWACDVAKQSPQRDLLELYCGNGNFTLPLSRHFKRVLATELAKSSVHAAEWNIQHNHIENIQIARLSAEEFTEAFNGVRVFRRLQEAQIELNNYDFSCVFVDPPRAGIDLATLKLLQGFEQIIYISCNPDSLCENLDVLTQTHDIIRFALFDQFPHTHHIESGVLLRQKTNA